MQRSRSEFDRRSRKRLIRMHCDCQRFLAELWRFDSYSVLGGANIAELKSPISLSASGSREITDRYDYTCICDRRSAIVLNQADNRAVLALRLAACKMTGAGSRKGQRCYDQQPQRTSSGCLADRALVSGVC